MWGWTPTWVGEEGGEVGTLAYWRARVLSTALLSLLALGLAALIPGLWIAVDRGFWGVFVADLAAYGWLLFATLWPGLSLRARSRHLVVLLYALGIVLTLAYATAGAGRLWLLTVPVIASLLLGLRAGVGALVVVGLTLAGLLLPLRAAPPPGADPAALAPQMWLAVVANFLLLAALPTVGLGVLVEGLERTARRLQGSLDELRAATATNDRLAARLRQAEKLEAVGTVTGSVAHDFNNVLTAVGATNEALRGELAPEDPRREHVAEIAEAVRRGAALSRQLLAVGRREEITPRRVDLGRVVADMVPMLGHLVAPRCLVGFEPPAGPLPAVVDPGQIERVLLNLVINARDASPDGATIAVRAEARTVDDADGALPAGRYVAVVVADQGLGMDPATRARIFEPFFTTKPRGEGTGLGLATVWGIAQQNGGDVRCDTVPGRGTTFTLLLPIAEPAARGGERDAEAPEPISGVTRLGEPSSSTAPRRTG